MKGDHDSLVVSTTTDELTGDERPLVQVPVQVCNIVSSTGDVRFDVAAPSGAKRQQVYLDPATGEQVSDAECPRGVRIGDQFYPIDAESRTAIEDGTKLPYMRVAGKGVLRDIMGDYGHLVRGSYYLQVPTKNGSAKAYRLIYEALREQRGPRGKVTREATALVMKRTAKSRQKVSVVYASENDQCLVMLDIAFPADVQQPDDQVHVHLTVPVADTMIDGARTLIDSMPDAREFLSACDDDTREQRQELIDKVVSGEAITAPTVPVAETVEEDALEAALLASIGAA